MNDGVAVVRYDCHSLRLLRGCHLDGTYGFMAFSKKEQTVRFETADEVAASLPAFGLPLLAGLHGDLKADSTLDLAMILVGKKRTTVREARPETLIGGAACDGATHFVRGAFVGAFAMGTGTKGGASLGVGLFSAASGSSKLASYRDGDAASCQQVSAGASAPATCNALLRLELVSLGSNVAAKGDAEDDEKTATCPPGLVLTEGKCSRPTASLPHQCDYGDLRDCTNQCKRQHAGSCDYLSIMYWNGDAVAKDEGKAIALSYQACDAGAAHACSNLGKLYLSGTLVPKDQPRAVALFQQSCDGGYAPGCWHAGVAYKFGEGIPKDYARAVALYQRGCDGGFAPACLNLGFMYSHGLGVDRDEARAVAMYKRTCEGGLARGCANVGERYADGSFVKKDEAKAAALFKEACDAKDEIGCFNLGFAYEKGLGVPADRTKAVALYRDGCSAGNTWDCEQLKRLGISDAAPPVSPPAAQETAAPPESGPRATEPPPSPLPVQESAATPADGVAPATEPATTGGGGMGTQRIVGLVVGGVGAAGLAMGSVFGVMTLSLADAQRSDCSSATSCSNYTKAANDRSTGTTDGTISTVGFIAGGALLVGGGVLFFTGGQPSQKQATTGMLFVPSVGPGGGGFSLRGEF